MMDRIEAIDPDDQEIDCDDKAQQPRNDQDQDASNKGNDWHYVRIGEGDVHGCFLVSNRNPRWEARQAQQDKVASTHGLPFGSMREKIASESPKAQRFGATRYGQPKGRNAIGKAASLKQEWSRISRRVGARALPRVQETPPQKGEMERREAPGSWAAPRERMLPPARASGAARATGQFPRENRLLRARGASRRSTARLLPSRPTASAQDRVHPADR
jgi:hypothetical protein